MEFARRLLGCRKIMVRARSTTILGSWLWSSKRIHTLSMVTRANSSKAQKSAAREIPTWTSKLRKLNLFTSSTLSSIPLPRLPWVSTVPAARPLSPPPWRSWTPRIRNTKFYQIYSCQRYLSNQPTPWAWSTKGALRSKGFATSKRKRDTISSS